MAYRLYGIGLWLMAASIPLSVTGMSLAQFILGAAWLLAGDYQNRLKKFYFNRAALLWSGLYGLHLIGSLWSHDVNYLLHDLRIKLPLFTLPFLLASFPDWVHAYQKQVFRMFILGTATSTFIGFGAWMGILPVKEEITDVRQISLFISHIRLSLCIVFSVFLLLWFGMHHYKKKKYRLLGFDLLLIAWFLVFLNILESMTGVVILIVCLGVVALLLVFRNKHRIAGWTMITVMVAAMTALATFIYSEYKKTYIPFDYLSINPEEKTLSGNDYYHCFDCKVQENGTPVYIYICEKELEEAWNRRSVLPYRGSDKLGHELKYTLIRYLASKGLRKDAAGVKALTDEDIHAIESGIANVLYRQEGSLRVRLHKILTDIRNYTLVNRISGSSLIQRLEYWRAGWHIFTENWMTGVGTGDVKQAFHDMYIKLDSPLEERWRLRTHNQYLTFALTFGIAGIIYFLIALFYPLFRYRQAPLLFYVFVTIAALSFINEDTLETQAGISFVMFFMSLFITGLSRSRNFTLTTG
jgi:hypothetical protein